MALATGWLVVLGVVAALGTRMPLVQDPKRADALPRLRPSGRNLLGTDEIGRDVLARLVHGARLSIPLGIIAVFVAVVTGGLLGLLAGYLRGWTDAVVLWVLDVLVSFPPLVTALAVSAFVGRTAPTLAAVLGLLFVPPIARLVRTHSIATAPREYVIAARVMGASRRRIVVREIVPAVAPHLVVYSVTAVASVIVIEGALSFLGLSVPPPQPTWGGMITAGRDSLAEAPHIVLFPVLAMFLTVLSLNIVAETLRAKLLGEGA